MRQSKGYTGYRVLSQKSPSADEAILEVETQMASAPEKTETLKFRRFGNDWKVVIDEAFINLPLSSVYDTIPAWQAGDVVTENKGPIL